MNRRLPHTPASPARTGGDDQPRAACLGYWLPFDMLIEYGANRTTEYALKEAEALCNSCPLQTSCWADNWDEPWMLAMRGQPVPRHHKPKVGAA